MNYGLPILFLVGLTALPLKAETLKGRIIENELRGPGIANVEIVDEAQTTNPTVSDDSGRFSLEFPTKHVGEPVRIVVKKTGYTVVNWEFLDQRLPAAAKADDVELAIVVCPQKDYAEWRPRYDGLPAEVLNYIVSKFKEQVVKGGEPKRLAFSATSGNGPPNTASQPSRPKQKLNNRWLKSNRNAATLPIPAQSAQRRWTRLPFESVRQGSAAGTLVGVASLQPNGCNPPSPWRPKSPGTPPSIMKRRLTPTG
jgi:hypothetical protein